MMRIEVFMLTMVISTSLHDLMCAIYLLDEYEEGEGVGHDEVRYTECPMRNIRKKLKVYSIAPTYNEYEVLALIATIFEHISEFACTHALTTLIEEYDCSREFRERFLDIEGLLDLDILRIGMRYGFYGLEVYGFPEALSVLVHCFAEVLEAICNRENRYHRQKRNSKYI